MNSFDWIQVIIFIAVLIGLTPILGRYMANVYEDRPHLMKKTLGWLEKMTYSFCHINPKEEMNWKTYCASLLLFNGVGLVFLFMLMMFQGGLPLNPTQMPGTSWHLAFNTAISFVTNTNWQAYAGESTMSYLTQMLGLAVQNFLSAATGMSVMLALIRGLSRSETAHLGNFWNDLTKSTIYILLPLSLLLAVFLMSQGVVQNFSHYVSAKGLEGIEQILPMGPAASQIAIKQLGTNGGGFFNVNSAHPFENPTAFSNFWQVLSIFLIPASLIYTYGLLIKSKKQALIIYAAMILLFIAGLGLSLYAEFQPNSAIGGLPFIEGKETRFGITNSVLWSVVTTSASNGSVNAMHASLSPLAGAVALFNMMLGEIIFGGVGAGFYGMIVFVLLTVFIAGLMVGRTPEYLGKKIQTKEIAWLIITILAPSAAILLGSGIAFVSDLGLSSLLNKGPHGLSEILYAFTSASQNNGSAFAGLNANTPFYNVGLGICMLIGRFTVIIPILAVAGSLAQKKQAPPTSGTFKTDNGIFLLLLLAIIIIVGALTHLPALALGPIAEHLLMNAGQLF